MYYIYCVLIKTKIFKKTKGCFSIGQCCIYVCSTNFIFNALSMVLLLKNNRKTVSKNYMPFSFAAFDFIPKVKIE